jgi:hypothetical protein
MVIIEILDYRVGASHAKHNHRILDLPETRTALGAAANAEERLASLSSCLSNLTEIVMVHSSRTDRRARAKDSLCQRRL